MTEEKIKAFFEMHIPKRNIGQFTQEELDSLKGKLPDDAIEFLMQAGISTFGNDFIWTVLPDGYHDMLKGWGLEDQDIDPAKCYVFLRTSLGTLIYFHEEDYYFLSPFVGRNVLCGYDLEDIIIRVIDELPLTVALWINLHKRVRNEMPQLLEDEIYALSPAVPLGGDPDTSRVDVVKMREHLAILSELYDHTVAD